MTKLRRLVSSERGYTFIELLQVMVILSLVMAGLTTIFVRASSAELDMSRRYQAQQEARVAVDRMRREVHCASAVTPAGASASIAITVPSQCPTSGGSQATVTYRTVLVSAGRYKLERQVGAGAIQKLADYVREPNIFTYTAPTQTSLGTLIVQMPINIQPPGSGSNWDLRASMVLRNTSRLP